jgi:hypothetical protein
MLDLPGLPRQAPSVNKANLSPAFKGTNLQDEIEPVSKAALASRSPNEFCALGTCFKNNAWLSQTTALPFVTRL